MEQAGHDEHQPWPAHRSPIRPRWLSVRSYRRPARGPTSIWSRSSATGWVCSRVRGKDQGNVEAYEFTDIDRTVSAGLSLQGTRWNRGGDTVGFAAIINGISADRERYLNAGGLGVLIGDGKLPNPRSRKKYVQTYYALSKCFDMRLEPGTRNSLTNPGLQPRDRGPGVDLSRCGCTHILIIGRHLLCTDPRPRMALAAPLWSALLSTIPTRAQGTNKERAVSLALEFKEFAMKGNVVDLAVGVIIGAAFGKIVSSLVGDIFMPVLGKVIGGINFSDLAIGLGKDPTGKDVLIKYGAFIQTIFDFAHHCIRPVHDHQVHQSAQEPHPADAPPPAPPPKSEVLLEEIRDLLAKRV